MIILGYVIIFLFGFLFPIIFTIFSVYCLIGDFKGAPYVPTSAKIVDEILKAANLKKGQRMVEFGSGDGRVIRRAVKKYQVYGIGIELNLILNIYARIISKFQKLNVIYKTKNFFDEDLKKADVLFMFLLPKTLIKLKPKLLKKFKNKLIISHGFKIEGFEKFLVKKINRNIFPTYYYKIK